MAIILEWWNYGKFQFGRVIRYLVPGFKGGFLDNCLKLEYFGSIRPCRRLNQLER